MALGRSFSLSDGIAQDNNSVGPWLIALVIVTVAVQLLIFVLGAVLVVILLVLI